MGPHVAAIALPSVNEDYDAGTMCTVTGQGTTSAGGSIANTLRKVDVPVVSDADCRKSYGQSSIYDSMICAGLDAGGKDSCQVILLTKNMGTFFTTKKYGEILIPLICCRCGGIVNMYQETKILIKILTILI